MPISGPDGGVEVGVAVVVDLRGCTKDARRGDSVSGRVEVGDRACVVARGLPAQLDLLRARGERDLTGIAAELIRSGDLPAVRDDEEARGTLGDLDRRCRPGGISA